MNTTSIYVLRHGECEGGAIFRGSTDSPCTAAGLAQVEAALAKLPPVTAVISSPLQRCAVVAQIYAQARGVSLQTRADFAEINFGRWEGKLVADVEQEEPEAIARFWRDPVNFPPPGAESLANFQLRVVRAWRSLIADHRGESILLSTHGGVLRMILAEVLAMPLRPLSHLHVPHGCLSLVRYFHAPGQADWPQLMFHNGRADHGY